MEISKIKTYIGFAIKSRKIKFGVDDIIKLKNAEIILVSDSLGESALKKLNAYSLKKGVQVEVLNSADFFELMQNENIKAAAILDKNLAVAIKKNLTSN